MPANPLSRPVVVGRRPGVAPKLPTKLKLRAKRPLLAHVVATAVRDTSAGLETDTHLRDTTTAAASLATPQHDPQARIRARRSGPFGALPQTGFVRLPTILEVYPVSRARWWKGVKDGTLPPGVLLSPRVRAWPVEAIRKLLEEVNRAT